MTKLPLVLLGALAAPYVVGAIAVRRFVRTARTVTVTTITEAHIPLQVLARREETGLEFKAIGFRETGIFRVDGLAGSMAGYLVVFQSPGTRILGALLLIEQRGGIVKSYAEFDGRLAGIGDHTLVNNAGMITLTELPFKHVRTMRAGTPVAVLFATAREYISRRYGEAIEDQTARLTASELAATFNRESAEKVRRGILVERGENLVLSWRSAFHATFVSLSPWKNVILARQTLPPVGGQVFGSPGRSDAT